MTRKFLNEPEKYIFFTGGYFCHRKNFLTKSKFIFKWRMFSGECFCSSLALISNSRFLNEACKTRFTAHILLPQQKTCSCVIARLLSYKVCFSCSCSALISHPRSFNIAFKHTFDCTDIFVTGKRLAYNGMLILKWSVRFEW